MVSAHILIRAMISGLATGLLSAIPLGPAGIEAINRTISKNYKEGFLVSLGSVSADAFDIFLINFGILNILEQNKILENLFWIISGVFLCIVGYTKFKKIKNNQLEVKPGILENAKIKSMPYITGFLIAFLNPLTHSYWLTMSGTVIKAWRFWGTAAYDVFILFVLVGMIIWLAILNYFVMKGKKIISGGSANKVSIYLIIGIFGIGLAFILWGLLNLFLELKYIISI